MGKRKETTTVAPKKQKSMTKWEELYTDLSDHTAMALREARVKPDQLKTMADGELTAINGINETALEEIRAKYSADISVTEVVSTSDSTSPDHEPSTIDHEPTVIPPNKRHDFRGGKAITTAKSQVDRTKNYSIEEAVALVKKTNITSFNATVTLHLNLTAKDAPTRVELTFPYAAGAAKKVAIVSDELLAKLDKGVIDFDILVTSPAFMPKLAKYAKLLGPKGLMPNPKAGTVTPNPEAKAKEFEGGKTQVKAEPKYPLMHATVGKTSQPETELVANIKAMIEAVRPKFIVKATLAATMSPGIKIALS
jgi:large subunit ribosomal protein L1